MRFTPAEECKLEKTRIFFSLKAGASSGRCKIQVRKDNNGEPGSVITSQDYTITSSSHAWAEIDFDTQLTFDTDFWITFAISHMGSKIAGWTDAVLDHRDRSRFYVKDGWHSTSGNGGDVMIRAIVSYVGVEEEKAVSSKLVVLNQNTPNPILNETTISYTLPEKTEVRLKVYDVTGKLVRTLVDAIQASGLKRVVWDRKNQNGETMSSGIYFYRLSIEGFCSFTKAMVVL